MWSVRRALLYKKGIARTTAHSKVATEMCENPYVEGKVATEICENPYV